MWQRRTVCRSWCTTKRAQISRRVAEHHGEQPDDALDAGLVGELDLELGEVDLGLLAGRRLEAHLEAGADRVGRMSRTQSRHRRVAAGIAALLAARATAAGGQAGIGRQAARADTARSGSTMLVGRRGRGL